MKPAFLPLALALLILPANAGADAPEIVDATAMRTGSAHTISVTLRHADTGWDHYADGWSVRLPDGTELGYRTLYHPHVNEQPFTRTLGGIKVPAGAGTLVVVPHDSVHGWGAPFEIRLQGQ